MLMNSRRSTYAPLEDDEQDIHETVELNPRHTDEDDGPPPSILVEGDQRTSLDDRRDIPIKYTHTEPSIPLPQQQRNSSYQPSSRSMSAHQLAMWKWVNVQNLDKFLQDAYGYYTNKGIYCIILTRALNLATVGFVFIFSTFLLGCIDYSAITHNGNLSDIVIPHCVSRFPFLTWIWLLAFGTFYVYQVLTFVLSMRALVDMYKFYTHVLHIPDSDVQTISWEEIVSRISHIRQSNPLTALSSVDVSHNPVAQLDVLDVANRIMRQENYLIALFNKDLLNINIPIQNRIINKMLSFATSNGLTKALEWNLSFALLGHVFDEKGQVKPEILQSSARGRNVQELKKRFTVLAFINALLAPFLVIFLLFYSFFRYFEEYHKNPSSIDSRNYTELARWKFREFNELQHIFQKRLNMSYDDAQKYIVQFPNEKAAIVARFVAFVAGSFAAVLILASVIDPDMFLHFEISPQRTTVFYIGLFGTILAIARGMVPVENEVNDPERLLRRACAYTHHLPQEWQSQMHSKSIHREFSKLFELKIVIFLQEILSVVFTPLILYYSLPKSSPAIIDFVSQSTVKVDQLGYICSFAHFDFVRHGNTKFGAPKDAQNVKLMSQDGKLEKSVMNFKAANPKWIPSDQAGSVFVQKMSDSVMPSSRRNGGIKSPEFGLGEVYEYEGEQNNLEDGFGGDGDKGMLKMLQQFSFTRNHSNNFPQPF
ncbi:hypothetical protein E3P86_00822 [Wallemia ichthyophaga]|uniref:Autophagy-related protein 9 n=1 Tax=Wallemia ichthyophaga TaxID=245174 RepID=A0A4T0JHX0_WALIC|nr:hypothetical protein E3P86_00822 [Wallemia ichthyophaga]